MLPIELRALRSDDHPHLPMTDNLIRWCRTLLAICLAVLAAGLGGFWIKLAM